MVKLIRTNLGILRKIATKRNKLFAFTETDAETIPNTKWFTEVVSQIFRTQELLGYYSGETKRKPIMCRVKVIAKKRTFYGSVRFLKYYF